jgi:hypothetical protein
MSHAVFTVSVSGLDNEGLHDALAAQFVIQKENARRLKADEPLLPFEPFDALKASYVSFLSSIVQQAHESYIAEQAIQQAQDDELSLRWLEASESERSAALTSLPEATEH